MLGTLGRHAHLLMNTSQEATLEVSFLKVLLVSVICFAFFAIAIFTMGLPLHDPLLVGFLIVMFTSMPIVFAACLCFMLRCKIGHDGLRPAVPTFYQKVLRWEDIAFVQGFGSPFYFVWSRAFGSHCILPRRFLLKRPDSLKELIEQYAPADNIVRKKLAA